jgi:murein DD-endopeptidase MepM/ murein hydrolase activator NlpD
MRFSRTHTIGLWLVLTAVLTAPAAGPGESQGGDRGPGLISGGPAGPVLDAQHGIPRPQFPRAPEAFPSVRFRWPMVWQDWWHTSNYVDLNTGVGILDYDCHATSYDGHWGTDIIIRDFYEQAEGRYVLAVAPGMVLQTEDGHFDQNTGCVGLANHVILQHADGTETYYWHLRKHSVQVAAGDTVFEGQPLGLIASSGCSTDPHLHLEVQNAGSVYEPSAGACRAGESLWKSQQGHVFDNAPDLFYAGMSTTPVTGTTHKFRPPNVHHVQQTGSPVPHYFWSRLTDIHSGDQSSVRYIRPDDSTYVTWQLDHSNFYSYSWWQWQTDLPSTGSTGTWTIEYRINNVLRDTKTFEYDTNPYQDPVAVSGNVTAARGIARGRLEGSDADSDLQEFEITASPLAGELRLSGPRNRDYVYEPNSGYSGMDLFRFRVQDAQGAWSAPANMFVTVSPIEANALRLEGEDDHVSVPSNGSLDLAAFTLEAWIRRDTGSAGRQGIIDHRHALLLDNFGYHLFLQPDGRLRLAAGAGAAAVHAITDRAIPLHRWTHVAGTWDRVTLRVYIDGVEDVSQGFVGPIEYTGVTTTLIGGSFVPGESFRGEIEEARIWSVARSATELAQSANCAFHESPLPATVKAAWRFQGDAIDASGNGNDGARINGASYRWTEPAIPFDCTVQDLDDDTIPDGPDNCPLAPNAEQTNDDGDAFGDACDLCPAVAQRGRFDSDHDGVGDPCDLCPFVGDTGQVDSDADGSGDLCDPEPVNSAVGVPSDAITLALTHDNGTGNSTLTWNAEPHSATYEVFRGSLTEVAAGFYGVCQNGRDGNVADTTFLEDETPDPGEAFYFLVVGVSGGGVRGLAGLDGLQRQRDLRAKDCL